MTCKENSEANFQVSEEEVTQVKCHCGALCTAAPNEGHALCRQQLRARTVHELYIRLRRVWGILGYGGV